MDDAVLEDVASVDKVVLEVPIDETEEESRELDESEDVRTELELVRVELSVEDVLKLLGLEVTCGERVVFDDRELLELTEEELDEINELDVDELDELSELDDDELEEIDELDVDELVDFDVELTVEDELNVDDEVVLENPTFPQ